MGCRLLRSLDELAPVLAKAAGALVVQKYVEAPAVALCAGLPRKLDLRQMVLVTGWAPRRALVFDDALLRLAGAPYDLADAGDLRGHLCNAAYVQNINQTYLGTVAGLGALP